jgi:hypothetical protein
MERGIDEALACGTALVGDITNTLETFAALAASDLAAVVFYELLRFNTEDGDALVSDAMNRIRALPSTMPCARACGARALLGWPSISEPCAASWTATARLPRAAFTCRSRQRKWVHCERWRSRGAARSKTSGRGSDLDRTGRQSCAVSG